MPGELLENGVELSYRGPATLGRSGPRLQGGAGSVGRMVWAALVGAGWAGEHTSPRTIVAVRIGVPSLLAPGRRQVPATQPRRHEGGWMDEDGVVWYQQVGPLSGRAAGPGFRLVEGELAPQEREAGDALLRSAAVRAGWLDDGPDKLVELPEVRVTVSVARRNPLWEDAGTELPSQENLS